MHARPLIRIAPPTAEELGRVDICEVREIGSTTVTVFEQTTEATPVCTILLRYDSLELLPLVFMASVVPLKTFWMICLVQLIVASIPTSPSLRTSVSAQVPALLRWSSG